MSTPLKRLYLPAEGSVTIAGITAPPLSAPVLSHSKTITLTWPYVSPSVSLTIRAPEFGNVDEVHQKRVLRQSRGGDLIAYRDPAWSKFRRLNYTIAGLSISDAQLLQAFFLDSLGTEMGLLDFESRQWRGYVIAPESEIVQKGVDCQWEGKINFEGALA